MTLRKGVTGCQNVRLLRDATTVGLSVMMLTEPLTLFLILYTAVTVGGVVVGAGLCALWFYRVIRKTGLRIRFAAV